MLYKSSLVTVYKVLLHKLKCSVLCGLMFRTVRLNAPYRATKCSVYFAHFMHQSVLYYFVKYTKYHFQLYLLLCYMYLYIHQGSKKWFLLGRHRVQWLIKSTGPGSKFSPGSRLGVALFPRTCYARFSINVKSKKHHGICQIKYKYDA